MLSRRQLVQTTFAAVLAQTLGARAKAAKSQAFLRERFRQTMAFVKRSFA